MGIRGGNFGKPVQTNDLANEAEYTKVAADMLSSGLDNRAARQRQAEKIKLEQDAKKESAVGRNQRLAELIGAALPGQKEKAQSELVQSIGPAMEGQVEAQDAMRARMSDNKATMAKPGIEQFLKGRAVSLDDYGGVQGVGADDSNRDALGWAKLQFDKQQAMNKGPELTAGQIAANKAFGEEYGKTAATGAQDDVVTMQKFQDAKQALEAAQPRNRLESGAIATASAVLPDKLRTLLMPKTRTAERLVEGAVMGGLKSLGANPTDRDYQNFIATNGIDPALPAEENQRRVNQGLKNLQDKLMQKRQAESVFEKTGAIQGLNKAGGQPAAQPGPKTVVRVLRNKQTGQTKTEYSDGTSEIK